MNEAVFTVALFVIPCVAFIAWLHEGSKITADYSDDYDYDDDDYDPTAPYDVVSVEHSINVEPWFSATRWVCTCGTSGIVGHGSLAAHIEAAAELVEIWEGGC